MELIMISNNLLTVGLTICKFLSRRRDKSIFSIQAPATNANYWREIWWLGPMEEQNLMVTVNGNC